MRFAQQSKKHFLTERLEVKIKFRQFFGLNQLHLDRVMKLKKHDLRVSILASTDYAVEYTIGNPPKIGQLVVANEFGAHNGVGIVVARPKTTTSWRSKSTVTVLWSRVA